MCPSSRDAEVSTSDSVADSTYSGKSYDALPFHVDWANDINDAACKTYKQNIGDHIHCGDIWKSLDKLPQRVDVVIGGFPCQDISINGKRWSGWSPQRTIQGDGRSRYLCAPKVFVSENVKGLLQKYNRDSLARVLTDFAALGYNISYNPYLAADYGVPQMRKRVFIVGTAQGVKPFRPPWPILQKGDWMTSKEAIGDLELQEECEAINHIWSRAERSPEQGNRTIKADQPADTIREQYRNIQYHYSLPRRLSMREAARIQSFPDDFIFAAKLRETERQIGNAVPPVLAWHIAKAVSECLE